MSTSRKRARKKPLARPRRGRVDRRVVPVDAPPSNEPVFFTPQPLAVRLTAHGLTKLKEHVVENYGLSSEMRAVIDEIEAIRARELSVTEWHVLRSLRDDLARRGERSFTDIVDRVIEILETQR